MTELSDVLGKYKDKPLKGVGPITVFKAIQESAEEIFNKTKMPWTGRLVNPSYLPTPGSRDTVCLQIVSKENILRGNDLKDFYENVLLSKESPYRSKNYSRLLGALHFDSFSWPLCGRGYKQIISLYLTTPNVRRDCTFDPFLFSLERLIEFAKTPNRKKLGKIILNIDPSERLHRRLISPHKGAKFRVQIPLNSPDSRYVMTEDDKIAEGRYKGIIIPN